MFSQKPRLIVANGGRRTFRGTAAGYLLAGCVSPQRRVTNKKGLLSAAAFAVKPADSPGRWASLRSLPPNRFVQGIFPTISSGASANGPPSFAWPLALNGTGLRARMREWLPGRNEVFALRRERTWSHIPAFRRQTVGVLTGAHE
jgi:hypothetical protein